MLDSLLYTCISSLEATPSVMVLLAGVLPEKMFSSLFGGTVFFQLILDVLSIRKPCWVSSKDRNPLGKSFTSLCLKRFIHLNVSLNQETLYIYTAQVLFFAVGIDGGNSTINVFFTALFITHYCQTPYLSLLKGNGALQYNSRVAALGMLE